MKISPRAGGRGKGISPGEVFVNGKGEDIRGGVLAAIVCVELSHPFVPHQVKGQFPGALPFEAIPKRLKVSGDHHLKEPPIHGPNHLGKKLLDRGHGGKLPQEIDTEMLTSYICHGPIPRPRAYTADHALANSLLLGHGGPMVKSKATCALTIAYIWGESPERFPLTGTMPKRFCKKVEEEWGELKAALKKCPRSKAPVCEELGDMLFSLAQLGRHLEIGPEKALEAANHKFSRRFALMKRLIEEQGLDLSALSKDQKESRWERAKEMERGERRGEV